MLEVLEAGGLATLQDAGRAGWRRFGVPLAGPMDRFAFEAANLLAGNPLDAAMLEVGGGDLTLQARQDCVLAVTGAGYRLSVNEWDFPLWGSFFVRGGWQVHLSKGGFGMWAYVAAAGGFEAPTLLGSRATYLRGRFGGMDGRAIQPGDMLRSAKPPHSLMESAGRTISQTRRPPYGPAPTVDVIPGPQSEWFSGQDLSRFFSSTYHVSASSDRMGYRLEGPALHGNSQPELTSEGIAIGSIQVPADGQPIAMMADCATTGGYPKIACVTSASLPLLAQCTPGRDEVRFREVSVEAAQAAFRSMTERLRQGMIEADG